MFIHSINISEKKGTIKHSVPTIELDMNGFIQDAHAGNWHRQISLLGQNSVLEFEKRMDRKINPGEFGENITVGESDLSEVSILDRLIIGEVELEVTQIGKSCHGGGCEIFKQVGVCVMPKEGIFARVITPGIIKKNDLIQHKKRDLNIHIITMSDRAYNNQYDDLSGPKIKELITTSLEDSRWHFKFHTQILPDEYKQLATYLESNYQNADLIFITGGTGLAKRDITPDVVIQTMDKEIPGIMEHIRLQSAKKVPSSLLSRSVAGIKEQTMIFAIPGSLGAVNDYIPEIMKIVPHAIAMIHGIGH